MTGLNRFALAGLLASVASVTSMLLPSLAAAQVPREGTISATGMVTLKRQPDVLRMKMDLTAQGKDIKDALAKLKEMRQATKAALVAAGVSETSISFTDARIHADRNGRQRQMELMMRARMGGQKKTDEAAAKPVTLATTVKAEWPLSGGTDEMLVASEELRQKLEGMGKAAMAKAQATTPAAEEEAEEAEESPSMSMGYDDGSPKPGEPLLLFVSRISDDEHAKATADAFGKARGDAVRLAKAAGVELGALNSVQSEFSPTAAGEDYNAYVQQFLYRMMRQQRADGDDESREAIGTDPGSVQTTVVVMAAFAIK